VSARFAGGERALLRELRRRAPPPTGGLARHLKGWQAGFLAVAASWIAVLLIIPRGAPPDHLPVPRLSPRERAELDARRMSLAREAETSELHGTARVLGSTIRELGRAEHAQDRLAVLAVQRRLEADARDALRAAPAALPVLRAYQAQRFVEAVRRWEASGVEDDALIELGGELTKVLREHGWVDERGGERRILPDDLVLAFLHERRFNELLETPHPLLELDLTARRAWLRFAMAHPPRFAERGPEGAERGGEPGAPSRALTGRRDAPVGGDAFVLRKIPEVEALDPSYPAMYARGILWMRMQRWEPAAEAFAMHLESHRDGRLGLRAQNHLRHCLDEIAAAR